MDNDEWKSNMQDMQELASTKKKSVAGQFAAKYRSETYCWTQKLNREDYGVDKYWVLLFVLAGWDLKLAGWDYDF